MQNNRNIVNKSVLIFHKILQRTCVMANKFVFENESVLLIDQPKTDNSLHCETACLKTGIPGSHSRNVYDFSEDTK